MSGKAKKVENQQMEVSKSTGAVMTAFFGVLSLAFLFPIFLVLVNSFKSKLYISDAPFQFPKVGTYVGLTNYFEGVRKTGFFPAFGRSLFITVCSVAVIVLFTSMTAWYITRVKSKFNSILYYVFVFAMIVPFQMVMFTMSKTANDLYLNSMYGLVLLYLGFGAGPAVFLFCGFVKAIPLEIEEASMIDGCNPIQTFFLIVLPILKPTLVSVGILEAMWVWNDYLLPTLVLDIKKYKTIPMLIQYFRGSYGKVEMGPMMASIMLTVIPIVIVYLLGQKHIIKGVAAGAVKG